MIAKLTTSILSVLILSNAFLSCNIYKANTGTEAQTPDEHILEGQINLQRANYPKALAEFDAALNLDSTKSEAYYGAAKASLLNQHINMFKLIQSFQNNDSKSIPFLGEPDSVKDQIYVANRGINKYLGLLLERDRRKLSDSKISSRTFSADYALSSAIEAVLSLADFNGDGRINAKDNILSGIIDFTDPSKLNPDSIMANIAALKNDTVKIEALNQLLEKSQELLAKSGKAIDLFLNTALNAGDSLGTKPCAAGDSVCLQIQKQTGGISKEKVGDSAITQVKKYIQEAGSSMVMYKVFDREDNDGDGCLDEELLDGIDNDGDGRVDEDSRGAPDSVGNSHFYTLKDGADNNMEGQIDEEKESDFSTRYRESFIPVQLLIHPERKGQVFWAEGGVGLIDSRKKILVVLDSLVSPIIYDTVSTFDLCKGKVQGIKKVK